MKGDDALRILGIFGDRLVKEPTARRDITALLVVVADLAGWSVASDLGGAMGLEGDQQEAVHASWLKGKK
jgi:hypothetical protein